MRKKNGVTEMGRVRVPDGRDERVAWLGRDAGKMTGGDYTLSPANVDEKSGTVKSAVLTRALDDGRFAVFLADDLEALMAKKENVTLAQGVQYDARAKGFSIAELPKELLVHSIVEGVAPGASLIAEIPEEATMAFTTPGMRYEGTYLGVYKDFALQQREEDVIAHPRPERFDKFAPGDDVLVRYTLDGAEVTDVGDHFAGRGHTHEHELAEHSLESAQEAGMELGFD